MPNVSTGIFPFAKGHAGGQNTAMKDEVRRRFAAVIEAAGIEHKKASLMASLGETYVRDAIKRGRGSLESVLTVVKLVAPDYVEWVQFGRGEAPPERLEPVWLENDLPTERKVPIVGYAGAGGEARFLPIEDEDALNVYAPTGTVAVKVKGVSLGAPYDGWYALYRDRREPFTDDLYGQLCVVGTDDERVLVKWVRPGRGIGVQLHSGIGEIEEDVTLLWAAPVISLQPK